MGEDILKQLDTILQTERDALLAGELDALQALLDNKQAILERLRIEKTDDEDGLRNLQSRMLHNQKLLEGALEGIRAVTERLAEVQNIRKSLDTYTDSGKRTELRMNHAAQLEKRA